tara:strand:- start:2222 stop:2974 length:753 start_codon:yes stop_codon:yes gene_type:complete
MHVIISPAKTLDMNQREMKLKSTHSPFLDKSQALVNGLSRLNSSEIQALMKVSRKIGELNANRFNEWSTPFTNSNAKPAIFAFKGDVYSGLDADSLSDDQIEFAQMNLSILSGLYGLLRPLDLMQAYRLEMGTNMSNQMGKNLYEFWGDQLTNELNRREKDWLINLASNEYFKSIKVNKLSAKVIQPVFKDEKNGVLKIVAIYAKKARGMMSRFVIENKVQDPEELKRFNQGGYAFCASISSDTNWVFTR